MLARSFGIWGALFGAAVAVTSILTPAYAADGKAIFATNCVLCHGAGGVGDGPASAALNPKPRNFTKDDFVNAKNKKKPTAKEIVAVLKKGYKAMPPFGHLPEADLKAVADYVLTFRPK